MDILKINNRAHKNINIAIKTVLDKYDISWFTRQSEVDAMLMSNEDHIIYTALYDALDDLLNIEVALVNKK